MLSEELYSQYRLGIQKTITLHSYEGLISDGHVYVIVPLHHHHHRSVDELAQMAQYLRKNGENGVGQPVLNVKRSYVSEFNKQKAVLYYCEPPLSMKRTVHPAKELAQFHLRGSQYRLSNSASSRYGTWPEVWGSRIDQMEGWRKDLLENKEDGINWFDEQFISTFPYYLGLAENVIQYAVDAVLDSRNEEVKTICHHRFHAYSWDYEGIGPLKLPSEWIIDYPVRDVAEWIRFHEWNQGAKDLRTSQSFLQTYVSKFPISNTAMRLLFSRLMFPIVYIETIEGYYRSSLNKHKDAYAEQLEQVLHRSTEHEANLRAFQQRQSNRLPQVDWLN